MNGVLGVIPARLGSTRLPRKPLQHLLGTPLIAWVWARTKDMPFLSRVVVATDAPEVEEVCERIGAEVMRTSHAHPTGSDRVWEVADRVGEAFEVIVNIQGDEPLMEPDHVEAALRLVTEEGWEIGTCSTPIVSAAEMSDPSVVKVVRAANGRALYFSRAPIPHRVESPGRHGPRGPGLRHLGLYVFRREALRRWVELGPSPLETAEGLEQLRALENGLDIGVSTVGAAARGVDTPEDVIWMESRLRELGTGRFEDWARAPLTTVP